MDKIGLPTLVLAAIVIVDIGAIVLLQTQGVDVPSVIRDILPILVGGLVGIQVPSGRESYKAQ